MTAADDLLTTADVAQLLRVHPKQVYRLLRRGLPALRVGDEWRFQRERVLDWAAAARSGTAEAPGESSTPPPLLAANGDCVIDALLAALRSARGPLLGITQSDHLGALDLLATGRVLLAGLHVSRPALAQEPAPLAAGASGSEAARYCWLHLVEREVGLVSRSQAALRSLAALERKRLASRPATAGVRRHLDRAIATAGLEPARAYRQAIEYASHRDVVLAVLSGRAELGITTQAWARASGLEFRALGSEAYELAVARAHLADPRVAALCDIAQSRALRTQLQADFGYDVTSTGMLRDTQD